MVKTKYDTHSIELTHPLDNLNFLVKNETTKLIINLNYEEIAKVLDLSNFNNLIKLIIVDKFNRRNADTIKNFYDWVGKLQKNKDNLILNSLSVISSSILKINCTNLNISQITNLPITLTHLRCSNNNINKINYLPPTLKILEIS